MTGCRITTLTRPAHPLCPSTLTAACGWRCQVEQGREWASCPERTAWLAHVCHNQIGATA